MIKSWSDAEEEAIRQGNSKFFYFFFLRLNIYSEVYHVQGPVRGNQFMQIGGEDNSQF